MTEDIKFFSMGFDILFKIFFPTVFHVVDVYTFVYDQIL